ncbi:hypothetical protein [Dinoroseobacter sp. S124A]|uniref:hypothetical protein n=1 Tax=Dinoroseobacter sp. S124A TaxID=3415128 RepID=UPI003C79AC63
MRDSSYLRLLGGDRSVDIEIEAAGKPGDLGTVKIIGDLVKFEAGSGLTSKPFGQVTEFVLPIRAVIDETQTVAFRVPISAVNTPDGVELTLPGGRTVTDTAYVSPISVADQLDTPLSFSSPGFAPITVDDSIIVDIFNTQNPQFLAAISQAQGRVNAAQSNVEDAQDRLFELEDAAFVLGEAFLAREGATALRQLANIAEDAVVGAASAVNAATSAFNAALFDLNIAQTAVSVAQSTANSASAVVNSLNSALSSALSDLNGFLNDAFGFLADFGFAASRAVLETVLNVPILGGLVRPLYDEIVDLEDEVDDLRIDLSAADAALSNALNALSTELAQLGQAQVDFAAAEQALNDALSIDIDALEDAFDEADVLARQAEADAERLEKQVEELGYSTPVKLGDLDDVAFDVAEALAALGLAEGAKLLAEGELLAANLAYEAQLALLPDADFEFTLSDLGFDVDLQAGLEFNWNRATDDAPRESLLSLVYEVEIALAVDATSEVNGEVNTIDIDRGFELSGRVPFEGGGRDRADRFEPGERWAELTDSFDFV